MFLVATTKQKDGSNLRPKYKIILGLAVFATVALIGGLVGYFVTKKNSASPTAETSSGSVPPMETVSGASPAATESITPTNHTSTMKLFGYWGQSAIGNGVGPLGRNTRNIPDSEQQQDIYYYCKLGYYQIMNIAFLYEFGGGDGHWGLDLSTLGRFRVDATGTVSTTLNGNPIDSAVFKNVGDDIKHCQAMGIKVLLSIGGDMHSPYDFIAGDGSMYANIIYNSFLQGDGKNRPFGDAVLDGIEFDIEKTGALYTQEQIVMLQTLKQLSPKSLFSAVPQCFLNHDANMDLNTGPVIQSHPELFDYVIIQYYNNPSCSYPFGFNFQQWKSLYKGPLVVGLAGHETSAITGGFLNPGQLQAVVTSIYNDSQFYGISVYDVSSSNPAFSNYSQILRNALDGQIVGTGYPPQGPYQSEGSFSSRCAGTWNYANETCSLSGCSNGGCSDPNQMCFTFLAPC